MRALLVFLVLLGACASQRGTIGAVLGQSSDQRLYVREIPEGLAADRAGLEVGDEILTIDGKDVRSMTPAGVHDALAGVVGEPVKLTLIRKGQVVRVTVKRTAAQKYSLRKEGQ